MSTSKALSVGARVRLKRHLSVVDSADENGIVTRIDARGVVVKLDSGRVLLVEPAMVNVVD